MQKLKQIYDVQSAILAQHQADCIVGQQEMQSIEQSDDIAYLQTYLDKYKKIKEDLSKETELQSELNKLKTQLDQSQTSAQIIQQQAKQIRAKIQQMKPSLNDIRNSQFSE